MGIILGMMGIRKCLPPTWCVLKGLGISFMKEKGLRCKAYWGVRTMIFVME